MKTKPGKKTAALMSLVAASFLNTATSADAADPWGREAIRNANQMRRDSDFAKSLPSTGPLSPEAKQSMKNWQDKQAKEYYLNNKAALDGLDKMAKERDAERAAEARADNSRHNAALSARQRALTDRETAQLNAAAALLRKGQTAAAVDYLRRMDYAGSARAPYVLGTLYLNGQGVKRDYSAARSWLTVAAKKRHPQACTLLGSMYFDGLGMAPKYDEAVKWFESSRDGQSYYILGCMYSEGIGVPKDTTKAGQWFKKAAWEDSAMGKAALGELCYFGIGQPKNLPEAIKWFTEAPVQTI